MTVDLAELRFIRSGDVYKGEELAGTLERRPDGAVAFLYGSEYLTKAASSPIASTIPLSDGPVLGAGGSVPAFFAGLLPEGRRLTLLRRAVKTSLDDELTLLLAVGADVPGDVRVLPHGTELEEAEVVVDVETLASVEFAALMDVVDRHGLPGVQDKLSAQMISAPVAARQGRFILKLDPADYPHLVRNEALHLQGAAQLKLAVASAEIVRDGLGIDGLLVRRFDRVFAEPPGWRRLGLEDGAQALGLPPAAKYTVESESLTLRLASLCSAPLVAVRNLYLQFVFAWLTGNGDLHAKNVSVLTDERGEVAVAPIYDIPCTLLYGDDTLALPVAGKTRNLRARHWAAFAESIGLPDRAAASANALALKAANAIDLGTLPFKGSPLNGAQRELRFRRAELAGS